MCVQLQETSFGEHTAGGPVVKEGQAVRPKDSRTTNQIVATCKVSDKIKGAESDAYPYERVQMHTRMK
jgi:hypothetical protein